MALRGPQFQFMATVLGPTDTSVDWTIQATSSLTQGVPLDVGTPANPGVGGYIDQAGLYISPAVSANQTYYVVATSHADPSKKAVATVTVVPQIVLAIAPRNSSIPVGVSQQFTIEQIIGGDPTDVNFGQVTWWCSRGTISATGLFNPGTEYGSITVKATSKEDPLKFSSTLITVATPITINISPAFPSIPHN